MKRIKIVITAVLSVAIILFALNYILLKIYAGEYYRASEEAIETVQESNDLIEVKKTHPCGSKIFSVLRVGMDFKKKCEKCGREIMLPRFKVEKNIRKINGEKVTN